MNKITKLMIARYKSREFYSDYAGLGSRMGYRQAVYDLAELQGDSIEEVKKKFKVK